MNSINPDEIVIYGTTGNGKTFRPSDWAERLCGILSSFDKDHRLSYHQWVRPLLVGKIRSVAVGRQLETINPPMFRFLMDFAADNDLRVLDADALAALDQPPAPPQPATPPAEPQAAPAAEPQFAVREIAAADTAAAFAALSSLHPELGDARGFAEQVDTALRPCGYRLFGVFEEGKSNAAAVCGLRTVAALGRGRRIVIEDLATVPKMRRKGCAALLLQTVAQLAAAENAAVCADLPAAAPAEVQRLFSRHGFAVTALHFSRPAES
ncbi:Protein of uncharacterised function (DUF3579) [Kingella potus]|uniref:Protein of uncharacterized function (DUF3579) n=1 Tax=Kingella potus TaxID=265175 RepID=A0A377QZQ1_9NEIS|nr:GNAT family N-acetyltransferase [Kingella potus]UOP00837.1 DUF3579 domain-containing protein [Kingella potus]STR00477.1 Protein of uncharacterised function (DUF3579) [Kingella potus]